MHTLLRAAALALLALPLLACDALIGDDDDTAYLEGFCSATIAYSDSLVTAGTVGETVAAIRLYQDALAALRPPDDVAEFHAGYLEYLDTLAANPAEPGAPPGLDSDVERRLDQAAVGIDECRETGFFDPAS